jgi:hypothetical protein
MADEDQAHTVTFSDGGTTAAAQVGSDGDPRAAARASRPAHVSSKPHDGEREHPTGNGNHLAATGENVVLHGDRS